MSPTTTPAQLPPTLPSLATAYRALVVGATGAIGAAMVAQLQADPRCAAVCALSRRSNPAIDFAAPDSIAAAAQALRAQGPWHLIVVATGTLSDAPWSSGPFWVPHTPPSRAAHRPRAAQGLPGTAANGSLRAGAPASGGSAATACLGLASLGGSARL